MRISQDPIESPILLQGYVYPKKETFWTVIKVIWHRVIHFFRTGEWLSHAAIIDSIRKTILPMISERGANLGRTLVEKEWKSYMTVLRDADLTPEQQQRVVDLDVCANTILFDGRSEYTISLNHFEERFGLVLPDDFADIPGLLAVRREEFLDAVIAKNLLTGKKPTIPSDSTPEELLFAGELNQRLKEARPGKKKL